MTDNERRAHDLTIAVLTYSLKPDIMIGEAKVNGQENLKINTYKAYMSLYNMFLELFNSDFPK